MNRSTLAVSALCLGSLSWVAPGCATPETNATPGLEMPDATGVAGTSGVAGHAGSGGTVGGGGSSSMAGSAGAGGAATSEADASSPLDADAGPASGIDAGKSGAAGRGSQPDAGTTGAAGGSPNPGQPIGTGWSPFVYSFSAQAEGCGVVKGDVFELTCSSTDAQAKGFQRAERRYANISSAQSQFQGVVTVNSFSGDRISLKQTFQDNAGPWNIIALSKAGILYEAEGGRRLAPITVGTPVRINTIADTSAKSVQVYVNGSLVETVTGGKPPFYDKVGTYRTLSGYGPITATWSNVQFWVK